MKEIAIIGPTASGKSDLALEYALKSNAVILSIDSLSIYKEIDIASAKPSKDELSQVKHFGINLLNPKEAFSVSQFISLYHDTKAYATYHGKNLVIVGGSSFYLKSLQTGLSELPLITQDVKDEAKKLLYDVKSVYHLLQKIDPLSVQNISYHDKYRLEKLLLIYLATNEAPSLWFLKHPPQGISKDLAIYNIDVSRDILKKRIKTRTKKMVTMGLVDEICYLEKKYTRAPNSMKAIGVIEVLKYLDGFCNESIMIEDIIMHTAQLAKRQQTFNRTQFGDITSLELTLLRETLMHL
jgi:tRNA dimethylallyltransferase